jgi:undecaprenyl diphosphate synthase
MGHFPYFCSPKSGPARLTAYFSILMSLKDSINLERLPKHIAIIMDGNGRWAKEKGRSTFWTFKWSESVRNITEGCAELGIQYLTLYAFSTENWDRPQYEVNGLMELLVETIRKEVPTLNKNNIRLHVIGATDMLPATAKEELQAALDETSVNTGMHLIMALSYSSRWEIIHAVQQLAADVESGKLNASTVTESSFQQYLATKDYPDPELMIRTSGVITESAIFYCINWHMRNCILHPPAGQILEKKICMKQL